MFKKQNTNYKSRNQRRLKDWASLSCQTDCQQGRVSDLWHYQQPQQKANSPVSQANAIRWQYSGQTHNFSTYSYARRSRKIGNQQAVSHSPGVQPITAWIEFKSTGWHCLFLFVTKQIYQFCAHEKSLPVMKECAGFETIALFLKQL